MRAARKMHFCTLGRVTADANQKFRRHFYDATVQLECDRIMLDWLYQKNVSLNRDRPNKKKTFDTPCFLYPHSNGRRFHYVHGVLKNL